MPALWAAGAGAARAMDGPPDATSLTPLIVSANRLPTPAAEVASSVTLITGDALEQSQERTLADALRAMPGLNLIQTGGAGGVASVFIRGTDSNHTKVLLDGIDVSDPSAPSGAFDFANLLTAGVERIEVLRGPQSGLYGSDAVGGVVDVITRAGSGPPAFDAGLEAGAFATFDQTGSASGSLGAISYRVDVAHLHVGATPVTPLDLLAPGESRHDDQYDNLTLATKLGLRLTPAADLGLVARYVNTSLRFTGDDNFGFFPDPVQSQNKSSEFFTRAVAHQSFFDGRFDQTFGVGYTSYIREGVTPDFTPTVDRGDRVKLDWVGIIEISKGEALALAAERQTDAIDNSPISARMTNDAGAIQLQSALADRLFDTFSLRYDANDRFGGKMTYRLAPAFVIGRTGTKLEASIGTGFKAPTLNELFVSLPQFGFFANPLLQPEKSLGYDLGFEQSLAASRILFGATYFHNAIGDLIAANPTFTTDINIGRASTSGIESFLAWRPCLALTLRADYTFTRARDDIAHQELLRRPKTKASLGVRWLASPALSVSATVLYVGPWIDGSRDFSIPRLTAPGYATVDIAANYALPRGVTLFARVSNLLDRRYQDPVGFQRPGAGVFAGARERF